MKSKSDICFDLAYLIGIVYLGLCLFNGENVFTHLYWTRLGILILMGICAILDIVSFINKVFIRKVKPTTISYIRMAERIACIILVVLCGLQ